MTTPHFIYSLQSAIQTWVTPAKWLPVESSEIGSEREVIALRTTGGNRGTYMNILGAKPVSGPMSTFWWATNIGSLLASFLRTGAATTVDTGVYDQGLVYDDTAGPLPISIQQQYSASLAINVLGATINQLTITAAQKAAVTLAFDFIAKDEAKAGGTWDYDGTTSSPAVITPTAYPTIARPLMFFDAGVVIGGTPSYSGTTKKITVGSGTSYPKIDNIQIVINNNIDAEAYALAKPDPTIQEAWPGDRDITVSFDISWADYATTFYDAARAATPMAVELDLVGPIIATTYKREGHIIIPSVFFDPKKLPPLTGSTARPKMTVTGKAQFDAITGLDFNLWIRTSEATL